MIRHRANGQLCERARDWASLRLDAEISEFEAALLDAHLARCAECRAFADEVVQITGALRSAELEPLRVPVVLPRRRVPARTHAFRASAAAALVLAAAGAGSLFGALNSDGTARARATHVTPSAVVSPDDGVSSLRQIRRQSLIFESRTPRHRRFDAV